MTIVIIHDEKNKVDTLLARMFDLIVVKLLPDRIETEAVRTEETMPNDNRHAIIFNLPVPDAAEWPESGGNENEP